MSYNLFRLSKNFATYAFVLLALTFSSCVDDDNGPDSDPVSDKSIIVLNEGQFGAGNGSISVIDIESDAVSNNVFESRNNFALGDVVQRLRFDEFNGDGYIVVNGSGKIEVVNPDDFTSLRTIEVGGAPNDVALPPASGNMLVTHLFDGELQILNKSTGADSGSLPTECSQDLADPHVCGNGQAIQLDGNIYIGNQATGALLQTTDLFTLIEEDDQVDVKGLPTDMAFDNNGDLWVLTNDWTNSENNSLYKFESGNLSNATLHASVGFDASNMIINSAGDKLYFSGGAVSSMAITESWEDRNTVFENADGTFFYGFAVDAEEQNLYLSDAKDFVTNGQVLKIDLETGTEVARYDVGVVPSKIYFR